MSRIREFELPDMEKLNRFVSVISDKGMSLSPKAALLGSEHKRVPMTLENHPVNTGHECAELSSK